MAGVKGRSGGARPGAGRPRKLPVPVPPEAEGAQVGEKPRGFSDPLEFLRAVWKGEIDANPTQVRAASAALPFVHQKLGEGGKKDAAKAAAEKVSATRFTPTSPPRLVAVK